MGCRDPSTCGSASSAREEVLGVKPPQLLGLLALLELLAGEFVDGLKHHEARLSPYPLLLLEEALINQGAQPV
jgi:hypothetical protein